ncbi:MAG TPA: DUF2786 domain-containing protein [Gammaproteobacteria bacterium]|nr:DUF2786 domain-containing protein [Gammaproteobacteria bacterium]
MTIQEVSEKKLQRIRALLAQAEDKGVTEEEAAAFHAKAFAMMAQYGIERAMIESSRPDVSIKPEMRTIVINPPWALDSVTLLSNLASALRCKAVTLGKDKNTKTHSVRVFGYASDLDRLDVLYTSLLIQMHSGVLSAEVPYWESTKSFRKGWLLGFLSEVISRVRKAEQYARKQAEGTSSESGETSTGTELVLVSREKAVAALVSSEFPSLRKVGIGTTRSHTGYETGLRDGRNADIGQARMSGRRAIDR